MDDEPIPPPGGWNIQEAGDALLPDLAKLAWSGAYDPNIKRALQHFSVNVLRALLRRDDLCITGRDFCAPADAPRITVSRDFYPDDFPGGFVTLDISEGSLSLRPQGGRETRLDALRVELRPHWNSGGRKAPAAQSEKHMERPPPRRSPSESGALVWMVERQKEAIKKHGRPMARDDLARACKEKTGLPTHKGRVLFKSLPPELRNPPRA